VNTSERTCILRPDNAKKSTQQSLCINFVRRRSSATLGNVKLNCSWHCFTRVISDVLNSFINSRLITKSNDWVSVLFRGHASKPYNKTAMHLLFMSCNVTSYCPPPRGFQCRIAGGAFWRPWPRGSWMWRIGAQVRSRCGIHDHRRRRATTMAPPVESQPTHHHRHQHHAQAGRRGRDSTLQPSMMNVAHSLMSARETFVRLPDLLCRSEQLRVGRDEPCWNGSAIAPWVSAADFFFSRTELFQRCITDAVLFPIFFS